MSALLEITKQHIEQLGDSHLRELVGLLCEAELRSLSLPTVPVTWGGHQDVADGGIDVRVSTTHPIPSNSNIPRRQTVFQVKRSDMPKSAIEKEMFPKGIIREAILNCIKEKGAYIIVSGKDSKTDKRLLNRQKAIKELLDEFDPNSDLVTDYYDSNRVATWVRNHPSVILWVRNKIGQCYTGWQPYGNWSKSPEGIEDKYIIDNRINLKKVSSEERDSHKTFIEGLEKLRNKLLIKNGVFRLVGMSGVGKTRLVQALFDPNVGIRHLSQTEVIYGDASDELTPSPLNFLQQLHAHGDGEIFIIDNCPTSLHKKLATEIKKEHSDIRLLTIEHDIQDNLPEDTDVYKLSTSSSELIQQLLRRRFPFLSDRDVYQIAKFADGNSRVAIYLAKSLEKGESISTLNDSELIDRLFQWKDAPNESIIESAELLSLIYSFDVEDIKSEDSELLFLSNLIDKSIKHIYRDIAIMQEKEVIQARANWRAIMPPALANKLAQRAFSKIPNQIILEAFLNRKSDRLITSLAHRMSLLQDNPKTVEIVQNWLSPEGFLDTKLNSNEAAAIKMLKYVVRIAPALTLKAIKKRIESVGSTTFLSKSQNPFSVDYIKLLKAMSMYDEYFIESTNILIEFAKSESGYNSNDSIKDEVASLFNPYSSKTWAKHTTRMNLFEDLIHRSHSDIEGILQSILSQALDYAEYARTSKYDMTGGIHIPFNRPKSVEEEVNWYISFLNIAKNTSKINSQLFYEFRLIVAEKFRELWTRRGLHEFLYDYILEQNEIRQWNEIWAQIHATIKYDTKKLADEPVQLLLDLRNKLAPKTLKENIRAYAMINNHRFIDIDEIEGTTTDARKESESRRTEKIRYFGNQLAKDYKTFEELLPEMVFNPNYKVFDIGYGFASSSDELHKHWEEIETYLYNQDNSIEKRRSYLAEGYLRYLRIERKKEYDKILDKIASEKKLNNYLVIFHCMGALDDIGYHRLMSDLEGQEVDITRYYDLYWKRDITEISEEKSLNLISKIASKQGGTVVAVDILSYGLLHHGSEIQSPSDNFSYSAKKIIDNYEFQDGPDRLRGRDYSLSELLKACCSDDESSLSTSLNLLNKLVAYLKEKHRQNDFEETLKTICKIHPTIFLDVISKAENKEDYRIWSIIRYTELDRNDYLNSVSEDVLFEWCKNQDFLENISFIFSFLDPFYYSKEEGKCKWKSLIINILNYFNLNNEVLDILYNSLSPSSWSGSRAEIMRSRKILLEDLKIISNGDIKTWASTKILEFDKLIIDWENIEWDREERQDSNLAFE